MIRTSLSVYLVAMLAIAQLAMAQSNVTIDYPGATSTTVYKYDVADNVVAGTYTDSLGHILGFLYNVGTATFSSPIQYPGATATSVSQDAGNFVLGSYTDPSGDSHGFTYDLTSQLYTPINYPGATNTNLTTYDPALGGLVGYADPNGTTRTFVYDSSGHINDDTWGLQGSVFTYDAGGLDAVGTDISRGLTIGFFHDGTSDLTSVIQPDGSQRTFAYGYDPGSGKVVGTEADAQGRVTTYTYQPSSGVFGTFNEPGAVTTYGYDIGGGRIVGAYVDANNVQHGFIATLPEPPTFTLLALAAPVVWLLRRRRLARLQM
jgi:YD repeat-containing protein